MFKMEDIVSELNFDEGIAMPVANLENKQLENEVKFCLELYKINKSCREINISNISLPSSGSNVSLTYKQK